MSAHFRRQRVATDDPDEGHAWLCQMYSDFDLTVQGVGDDFRFTADALWVGSCSLTSTRHTLRAEAVARDGLEQQIFIYGRLPTTTIEAEQRQLRVGSGDAVSVRPHVPYRTVWHSLDARGAILDPDQLADVAFQLSGSTRPVEFDFGPAVSPAAGAHWNQVCSLVGRVGLANTANPDGALLADELTRLLTTTALTCFPNTTMTDRDVGPVQTTPESLRRAVAYIDAHLHEPIRLADLAAAAGVSQRALNLTFNRHHDTSPIGYVRRARLDAAHHDLRAAHPGDGQSVTSIAARWGFYSLPRFGVAYRRAYGRPPSQTLRNS